MKKKKQLLNSKKEAFYIKGVLSGYYYHRTRLLVSNRAPETVCTANEFSRGDSRETFGTTCQNCHFDASYCPRTKEGVVFCSNIDSTKRFKNTIFKRI